MSPKVSNISIASTKGTDTWRHLVITVDKQQMKVYVNGRCIESRPCSKGDFLAKGNFYIGGSEMTGTHFDGLIDEVALLSRSMTEHEIMKMYRAGNPK